jgi:hypothetical protein
MTQRCKLVVWKNVLQACCDFARIGLLFGGNQFDLDSALGRIFSFNLQHSDFGSVSRVYHSQVSTSEECILVDVLKEQQQEAEVTSAATIEVTYELSSLQDRCIDALTQHWDCIDLDQEPHKLLMQQQPWVIAMKIYTTSLASV